MRLAGEISEERAADVRTDFADLELARYPPEAFSDRLWELRHSLTACDVTFVAPAEALDPLVTCDARLVRRARAPSARRAVRGVLAFRLPTGTRGRGVP